jgi:asparagine synthase (glutamine-hydrolysing)
MCGIGGIIDSSGAAVSRANLQALGNALAHRGPDGEGMWISDNKTTGFVHRRLAILDTSARGRQPMLTADARYVAVFNGEIYNFLELRSDLERLGHRFVSDSDTEVILAAWREWGDAMLPKLNGMWALAIHDTLRDELFLSRDRFGIKPLLYAVSGQQFAFASEVRAIAKVPFVKALFDSETGIQILRAPFSVEGTDRTLIKDVKRLPAGHNATIRHGSVKVSRWWCTSDHLVEVSRSMTEWQAEFRQRLIESVQLRLRSDVPVGTSLSGGFDSSTIAGVIAHVASTRGAHQREAKDWRRAFVASFPGETNDETPQAREAALFAGVEPHLICLQRNNAFDQIDHVLEDLDDIYIGLPTAPWLVYKEMRRQGVIVSLDGHGADELMGGYRQQGHALNFWLRNALAGVIDKWPAAEAASNASRSFWLRARGLDFTRSRRFAEEFPRPAATADSLPGNWAALNRRLYRMFHCDVLPTILRNFDRISMAHGVEIRMPFMDWRLVTYTMSLPAAAKDNGGVTKFIARQAMKGFLPESIRLSAQKTGFNSPMPSWLNGPLQQWVAALFSAPDPRFDEIVHTAALRQRINVLNSRHGWTWESASRLWPYINLKWYLARGLGGT